MHHAGDLISRPVLSRACLRATTSFNPWDADAAKNRDVLHVAHCFQPDPGASTSHTTFADRHRETIPTASAIAGWPLHTRKPGSVDARGVNPFFHKPPNPHAPSSATFGDIKINNSTNVFLAQSDIKDCFYAYRHLQ